MEVEWIETHTRNIYRAGHKGKVTATICIVIHSYIHVLLCAYDCAF